MAPSDALCRRCRRISATAIDRGRSAGVYEGPLRAAIHAFKYEGRRSLRRPLGALMRRWGTDVLAGADRVVPVPLHSRRLRQRGFNQAADLARELDRPVLHALRRVRWTAPQADLPAAQRHRNVRDAFRLAGDRAAIERRCLVIVDDVSTTGATLEACARALKAAGAREVRTLTAARASGGRR
jgi:ComF family protein